MRVKMLETTNGCEDGFTLRRYFRDQEYEIREELAKMFLRQGVCEEIILVPVVKKKEAAPKEEELILVFQLADKLNIEEDIIRKTAKKLKISATRRNSELTIDEANRIREALEK